MNSVCAVVVTYNRKELLIECIESLRRQTRPIQAIYLIDNASSDDTPKMLLEKGYIKELPPVDLNEIWEKEYNIPNLVDGMSIKLHYVRMTENTGGAGGFYEGVKRGYQKGYNWLWLMDDDAEPLHNALEMLTPYFKMEEAVALVSLKVDKNMNILKHHRGFFNFRNVFSSIIKNIQDNDIKKEFIEIDHSSFVGILIRSEAVIKIGYPKKEFFIHYDDLEYCIRLRKIGKILLIPKSIIIHKEEKRYKEIRFLGKKIKRVEFSNSWILYYSRRNLIWVEKKYYQNKALLYIRLIRELILSIFGIIMLDDHKIKRLKLLLNSYYDGLIGKFDNTKYRKSFIKL
ncbi:MAG: glycosyltransferase family 2 protein [Hydrogenobaculum sp.]